MTDLHSALGLRLTNKPSKRLLLEEVAGPITEADLIRLAEADTRGVEGAAAIKKLRSKHHLLAKLLAGGAGETEAGIVAGYVPSRVSVLKADPMFQELMAFYSQGVRERYYDMHEGLAALSADALEELRDKLEESPEDFSVGQLLEVVKMGADRTGFGPSQKTQVDVTVGVSDKLRRARERVTAAALEQHQRLELRDVTPESGDA